MAERVDVLIAGTGFGGSIAAYRLAESYRAAGANPNAVVMLERGGDYGHLDYKQSMDLDHLSKVYRLVQGQGGQFVTANAVGGGADLHPPTQILAPNAVGGGSNLYLAA